MKAENKQITIPCPKCSGTITTNGADFEGVACNCELSKAEIGFIYERESYHTHDGRNQSFGWFFYSQKMYDSNNDLLGRVGLLSDALHYVDPYDVKPFTIFCSNKKDFNPSSYGWDDITFVGFGVVKVPPGWSQRAKDIMEKL